MNDYKELIEELKANCLCLIYGDDCNNCEGLNSEKALCSLTMRLLKKATDAIEQLVRERDAAIADLETATLTTYPCHYCGKVNNCKYNKLGIMCMGTMNLRDREFEWRGVQNDQRRSNSRIQSKDLSNTKIKRSNYISNRST